MSSMPPPPPGQAAKPAPPPPRGPRGIGEPSLFGITLSTGKILMLVGLVCVLIARGCDTLGRRAVARANAKAQVAQNSFNDKWDAKQIAATQELDELNAKKEKSESDTKRITELNKQLGDMPGEKAKEMTKLQQGNWRSLGIAARDATSDNQLWGYWHECLFVLGTIVLALGLVAVGFQGQGAERWVSLLMLAIVTFSIYIAGTAWGG